MNQNIALILTSVEYHVALTVSTILGVLFNFKTTGTIVFRNNKKRLIFRFVAMYGIIYVLNQIVLTLLVRADINELVSQAIVLPVMVVLAFSMNRRFVFKRYDCSHH
jgi:putative flippase GtrA